MVLVGIKSGERKQAMSAPTLEKVMTMVDGLTQEEQLFLIERVAQRLRRPSGRRPQRLYGVWKGKFPGDMDLDAALQEIREGWQQRLEEATDE